ncbi:protein of unknown function [Agrobacterium pusense]|uniref:Uncharacterized protein n=1 Tax=Agrobacterium pusense TaxID=648995 RepID=U4Q302_9HYPH|nr:protein of unknown function [Agrobacterium pusense]
MNDPLKWANIRRLTLMLRDGGHLVRLATASNDRSEDDGAETSLAPPCPVLSRLQIQ